MRLLILSATALAITAVLVLTRPETQAKLQPHPAPTVATTTVVQKDVQPFAVKTGRLRPARKARLRFEVSGRVVERYVEPGRRVEAGNPLLRIDEGDYLDALREAKARLEQERQAIERDRKLLDLVTEERALQEREVGRQEKLGRESLSSQSAYDDAMRSLLQYQADEARLRYSVETARARLESRRADLERAQRNVERARLEAPFTATVNSVEAEVGDYVTSGETAVELVQLDKLDLYLEVPSSLASALTLGQRATVHVKNETRQGEIVALSADPDPDTNTHPLRIRLDANGLLPGLLAEVELPEPFIADALTIPVTSVLQEGGNAYVFKIDDRRLVKIPVKLTKRFQGAWVVDGLQPDTRIVGEDVAALSDGQKVTLRNED